MRIIVRFKDARTRFDFKGFFFARILKKIETPHSEILAKTRFRMTTVRLSRFPAKVKLVHARALRSSEKISYS